MSGRRGCVNSLWSGTERIRIGERLKATLAGVVELELLRCKYLEMVGGALQNRATGTEEPRSGTPERAEPHQDPPSHRQQDACGSYTVALPSDSGPADCGSNSGDVMLQLTGASNSRWSTLSWDTPSDLLSPPTPDPSGHVHLDNDSRPSSGFYSVSGSSLSDSCYSVSSDATQAILAPTAKPPRLWDPDSLTADSTDTQWSEGIVQQPAVQKSQEDADLIESSAASVPSDLEVNGLAFFSDLCSGFADSLPISIFTLMSPSSSSFTSLHLPRPQLDPRYCTDLVSRRTKETYTYPSPLHAVALQSPLFTSQSHEQPVSLSPEELQLDEQPAASMDQPLAFHSQQPPASFTQLEQYITRLAHQYRSRVSCSTSDLSPGVTLAPATHRGLPTSGKSHGSTQSLSAFETRTPSSILPGSCITPSKSLLGNSVRVSLNSTGKKASRNSINLGNLPSATGEDVNIHLHVNLNLNQTPSLNLSHGLVDYSKNGNCGKASDFTASFTAPAVPRSSSSASSSTTPVLRTRPRISTCPSSLSHRSSLEVTSGPGSSYASGPPAFSRSLDWSSATSMDSGTSAFESNCESAPESQRCSLIQPSSSSPKLNEDSPMVGEISRLSGLSRSVVVGLMEQGVELDIDCFQADNPSEVRGHSKSHLMMQTEQAHDFTKRSNVTPPRPVQLSLSVTHSPQSQTSITPPHSHSSSPIHPYQSIHIPSSHYSSHYHYQQIPSSSDLPSSTASSPASHPNQRSRSPPCPLQASPLSATPLSVFRRDAPFQCSMPRVNTRGSPLNNNFNQQRGGSLRCSEGGGGGGSSRWKKGEGLYSGKHSSHTLIRAPTVSSYNKTEDRSAAWEGDEQRGVQIPKKTSSNLWKGFEGHLWGKEPVSEREEMDRAEYGYGWRRNSIGSWKKEHRRGKVPSSSNDKRSKANISPVFLKRRGKDDGEKRSSSLRLSRRALFRSESQGLLVPCTKSGEPSRRPHWVSSLDVGQGNMSISKEEGVRLLKAKEEDKHLSSTASLYNISRSQSLEGSCHSLSPLSSPSFSPSPPPRMSLQRSRSLRDLGRKMFGSMRSLSLKRKPSKKCV